MSLPGTEEPADIMAALAASRAAVAELKASIAQQEIERGEAGRKASELARMAQAQQTKAREIENSLFDVKRLIRQQEAQAASLERQAQQAADNARLRAEFEAVNTLFTEAVKDMPYFDKAKPHQISGAQQLAHAKRAICGDTMGLGKSLTALITADMVKARKVLVIAPATVVRSFEAEICMWAPHRTIFPLAGTTRLQRRSIMPLLTMLDEFTVTVNYEAWRKDTKFIEELAAVKFDMVIADEAHTIKDPNSIAFRGVEKIVYAENILPVAGPNSFEYSGEEFKFEDGTVDPYPYCSVKHVVPMTGTPILNKPQDPFALLNLVDRHNFHSMYNFLRDYCTQNYDTGKWEFKPGGLDRLAKKIDGRFVRRTKESAGITLPPKTLQVHNIELDPEKYPNQYRASKQLNEHAAIVMDEERTMSVAAVIALITRKRQLITWPAGIDVRETNPLSEKYGEVLFNIDIHESVKVDYAMDLIDEVIYDEKVVLFSQFKAPLHETRDRLQKAGHTVSIIDGDTPMADRANIIERFQTLPLRDANGVDVILGNYKAMGVGVTLTAATQMIILDEEWNPGKNEQAYDRIHRIGQEKAVTIHILRVENSVDEWMAALNEEKANLVDGFVESTDYRAALRDQILKGML